MSLVVDLDRERGTWSFLPNDLWTKLVDAFVGPLATSVGFEGIKEPFAVERLSPFADDPPRFVGHGIVSFRGRVTGPPPREVATTHEIALFELNARTLAALRREPFDAWSVTSDDLPTDCLHFFRGTQHLLTATPLEGELTFSALGPDELARLLSADPRVAPNLHPRPGLTVQSSLRP